MFSEKIDVKESNIANIDFELLTILLKDRTTGKNIIWATDNYKSRGISYNFKDEITPYNIIGYKGRIIRPRIDKSKKEQEKRIKDKAEVFTPSWICNIQNNQIDELWFGKKDVFNKETSDGWITKKEKVLFEIKDWKDYIKDIRLEISCGEAPYLVSRYDTVTGEVIDVEERIGLLDRKFRVLNENVYDKVEWIEIAKLAFKSVYGYEWQGDSLLIARENLLYTFIDNYKYKFKELPSIEDLKEIAEIISWNIFQMDGVKFVIPDSCTNINYINYTLFGEEIVKNECNGCKKNNANRHNGIYVKVMNWETKRKIKFISLIK